MHRADKSDPIKLAERTERDELAAVLREAWDDWKQSPRNLHEFMAERLLEAGYTKGTKR